MMKRFIALCLILLATVTYAATITPTITINSAAGGYSITVLWEAMGNADTGTAVERNEYLDRSIQVVGTFGGATVTIQGSNDGTNFVTLEDYQGTGITFTSAGLTPISEATRYVRAITSGGTGTDVDVYLFAKRTN